MATSSLDAFLDSIRTQIADDEIQLALDQLESYLRTNAPSLYNEVILHTGRYNRMRRDSRKGLITPEEAAVQQTRIANAVLGLLDELPKKIGVDKAPAGPKAEISAEVSRNIVENVKLPDEVNLEYLLGANNLKQLSWIQKGLIASKSVCRILTPNNGLGSGFLIAPNLLMTNNHVIPDENVAAGSFAEFNYEQDAAGNLLPTVRYKLDAGRFHTSPEEKLDYTIVGVAPDAEKPPLEKWGRLALNADADPVPSEHVVIIQHPNGGLKQIVLTANQVVRLWEHRLQYTTDTLPGSSGSPVFNDQWQVIAIHHAGGDLKVNAQGVKRFVNEGILMSAIRADAGELWPG